MAAKGALVGRGEIVAFEQQRQVARLAELLRQLQQPDLPSNDFLILGHGV